MIDENENILLFHLSDSIYLYNNYYGLIQGIHLMKTFTWFNINKKVESETSIDYIHD